MVFTPGTSRMSPPIDWSGAVAIISSVTTVIVAGAFSSCSSRREAVTTITSSAATGGRVISGEGAAGGADGWPNAGLATVINRRTSHTVRIQSGWGPGTASAYTESTSWRRYTPAGGRTTAAWPICDDAVEHRAGGRRRVRVRVIARRAGGVVRDVLVSALCVSADPWPFR